MIQRVQSVYMLLVLILLLLGIFYSVISTDDSQQLFVRQDMVLLLGYALGCILVVVSIFKFNTRKIQFVLNRLNIALHLGVMFYIVYLVLNQSISNLSLGVWIPSINILLLIMANRNIKKDENLIKSTQRIR